ncbi:ECF transporter S component [Ammoniphilus oxalaticus]|uniref:ECF transporter S component n=1 Tax=Ammoniphilus oxalaticus TaxID=66863 RepID=A0A419SNE8_9BACL|nr:CD3073 family putative ECF transporter S component [Ammoniphilus oxalaticus]RKD25805.1 ECF transporter S component [Ammoniphilus oxalaticus]
MNKQTFKLGLAGLAIAVNVLAGSIVSSLKIPLLFLDAIGTIFIAVLLGPFWALGVGIVTNLVMGVTSGPTAIPFGLVNGGIGLVVGLIARKYGFGWGSAIISGIIISIVAPLIGTPISIAMFGGLTGGGIDIFVLWLSQMGQSIFAAAFIPRITSNFVDKILSCILVLLLIKQLPATLLLKMGYSTKERNDQSYGA